MLFYFNKCISVGNFIVVEQSGRCLDTPMKFLEITKNNSNHLCGSTGPFR